MTRASTPNGDDDDEDDDDDMGDGVILLSTTGTVCRQSLRVNDSGLREALNL